MSSIAVVICAYSNERRPQLGDAIDSVLKQTLRADRLIVVIDHNDDLLREMRRSYAGIEVVANDGARGLSGARNTGVRTAASCDIIAFLDDDAVAEANWLERLALHYAVPQVIGVGGKVLPLWPGKRPRWFPEEFQWVVGCSYKGLPNALSPVRNPIGCNMSFRRTVFDAVGGFREGLGRSGQDAAGCEETEFCIRARRHFPTAVILCDPQAVVHHNVTAERTRWAYFRRRCQAEGRSKNAVVEIAGAEEKLGAERAYVTRTLPAGVVRGLTDMVTRLDPSGPMRAFTIVAGFMFTTAAYLAAKFSRHVSPFRPVKIVDVDYTKPLPAIDLTRPGDVSYGGIFCLVRSGAQPLAIVELQHSGPVIEPADLLLEIGAARSLPSVAACRTAALERVAVVIATRDRAESLDRCLASLFDQTRAPDEVLVVDNAPASTATVDLISTRYRGRVHYVLEPTPGLGRAHNTGLRYVSSDIVLFTDDDVVLDQHWVEAMAAPMEEDKAVGCVTGLILPAELETRAQVWTERHGGFGKGLQRRVFDLEANRPRSMLFPFTAGQFGSGANMAFRASALRRVGGFDAALGAGTVARGGDDLAAFFAIVNGGFRLVYQPQGIIWHHHRRGEEGMRRQAYCYGMGLGAYLTKIVVDEPRRALRLAAAFPAGILHMAGPTSQKTARLPSDYPLRLVWMERLGILAGVPGYLRSLAKRRRDDRPQTGIDARRPAEREV
ncbi:glycosyltransferase (plasmid) [Ensifer adhaerens]|uniref:glycosyltransferase family 2 protein n=1 Tax=Ensifer adhaerens TaxID=106592 RepID=UPI0023A9EE6E|nr:glycosyltransferase [Ensifer adhaerens]WDZ80777.1 glycosyltransferase [Ensifer adhaerens]